MGAFFERVFMEGHDRRVAKLILDVRDNGGGEDELGRVLFSYFADQPFRYYRDLIVNKLSFGFFKYVPNLEPLPPNVDEMVRSGACEFLSMLHNRGGASFIGEETAGGYYGNTSGAVASVVLPNTRLILPVQLVGYYMAIEGAAQGAHGIRPDYQVDYSIDDVLHGRDRAMETVLRLATDAPPGGGR
jgi:C-terminal processing protease CtpA/Prc